MITKLQERLEDMKSGALQLPASMEDSSSAVEWDKPSDDPDLADSKKIRESFDREEAATAYKTAVDAPDTDYGARDAQAAKLQSDLLSSFQQGFVMRHRSRMQLMADAASLRKVVNESKVELLFERQIANVESAK